jgi:peptide/nickel transport system ATP-binding protein
MSLEVKRLSVAFGADKVVDQVNFRLKAGESLALVGESGSGKSLTALAIMQLLPPAAKVDLQSEILFEQTDLLTLPEIAMQTVRGRKVAMIFQEAMAALNPVLTIGKQITEVLFRHFKCSKKQATEKACALLEQVGIQAVARSFAAYPHELSGGMRQRAMIAIALAAEPEVLIADEPTTSIDVTLQAQILKLLKKLQTENNMALLFITHDLSIVRQMADKVAVMQQGKIVEYKPANDFFENPEHVYSKQLFAAIPDWPEELKQPGDQQLLKVKDLKLYFPIKKGLLRRTKDYVRAVDSVSFELNRAETLALVGESGCGKTTCARGVLRLLKVNQGEIIFNGENILALKSSVMREKRKDMQIIMQDPYTSMNPRMLVFDIIAEGMYAQKLVKNVAEAQEKVAELLTLVGLEPEHRNRYPHEFSGGQRQRICIARALALNAKFLICDEPTSALDVSVQMQILKLLKKLQRDLGLSILLITHNLAVVKYMADRIAVMQAGKIVEQGGVREVLLNPKHAYTQKLLSAVPAVDQINLV